jgi:hypothetical protein
MRSYYNGTRGIIYIQPLSAPSPFPVFCSFKEIRARTYIQRHYGTELEFNQSQMVLKVLRASKPNGLNRIAKIG